MNISEMTAHLLRAHGITTVVTSPGSRNAPIVSAMVRCKGLNTITLVDERASGFVALGIALNTGKPVAMVCTSGTALLNYAPALAEAYYRRVPLIAISADRPVQWIDQNDSQTMRQHEALSTVVAKTVYISDDNTPEGPWFANRMVNEAILASLNKKRPVHINIHIDFRNKDTNGFLPQMIEEVAAPGLLPTGTVRELASPLLSPSKIMIVAGFMAPDAKLSQAMARIAGRPNTVVLAEALSNLHGNSILTTPDILLKGEVPTSLLPDVVISTGGALVSAPLKRFIRRLPESVAVWHVGREENIIDCYKHLTKIIDIEPTMFFGQLSSAMSKPGQPDCIFSAEWKLRAELAVETDSKVWCAIDMFKQMVQMIPRRWNVHASNGTSIRCLQLCNCNNLHRVDCNRGVSGIEGSTMTALGASWSYKEDCTLLITGDMSLGYDLGWLTSPLLTPRFKILAINNNGGNIFRMVKSTKHLPERDTHFTVAGLPSPLPLAYAAGWAVFEACDADSFTENFKRFVSEDSAPAIMMVNTPAEIDAQILTEYL